MVHGLSFRSQIAVKVLNYFFLNPHARLYVNELARILRVDPKNLHRKLRDLEIGGILKSEFRGKERFFSLNRRSPLLREYRALFLKTVGLETQLRRIVRETEGVQLAYLFGSYAKDALSPSSDIDLLVIGNHSVVGLQKRIARLQRTVGREINIVNLSAREFQKRKRKKDPLLNDIFSGKHIALI